MLPVSYTHLVYFLPVKEPDIPCSTGMQRKSLPGNRENFPDVKRAAEMCIRDRYEVNQEWMMTIAYYRGTLDEYKDHPAVKALIEQSRNLSLIHI